MSQYTALTSGPWVRASTRIPAMIPAEQTAEMMAVIRSRVQPGHLSSGDTVILTPQDTESHADKLIVNVTLQSSQCHTRIMTRNTLEPQSVPDPLSPVL